MTETPWMLRPHVRAFLDRIAEGDRAPMETTPFAQTRAIYDETYVRLAGVPVDVGSIEDVESPGPDRPVAIRVYTPEGLPQRRPLVVFYHAGGYVHGSRNSHDGVCRLLTRESGCVVASVEYRLAPEHPAPAAFEDSYAAFEWLAAHAAELGADPARIAVAGDSSGGGLAANVSLKARDAGGPPIAHQLLLYPFVSDDADAASIRRYGEGYYVSVQRMAYCWRCYVPRPELATLPYLMAAKASSLRGLPPATIILAECDPLHDQGFAYAERLRAEGVAVDLREYRGTIHAFCSFIGVFPEGREALIGAAHALAAALNEPPARAHASP